MFLAVKPRKPNLIYMHTSTQIIPHHEIHSYQQYAHLVFIVPLSMWLCSFGCVLSQRHHSSEENSLLLFFIISAMHFSWCLIGCMMRRYRRDRLVGGLVVAEWKFRFGVHIKTPVLCGCGANDDRWARQTAAMGHCTVIHRGLIAQHPFSRLIVCWTACAFMCSGDVFSEYQVKVCFRCINQHAVIWSGGSGLNQRGWFLTRMMFTLTIVVE